MFIREPAIRQKNTGGYFVRWGGRDFYLSVDRAEAQRLFTAKDSSHPGSFSAWRAWKAHRQLHSARARSAAGRHLLLIDAERLMHRSYLDDGRADTARFWRSGLARFIKVHGEASMVDFSSPDPVRGRYAAPIVAFLNAYRTDMSRPHKHRLANRTINHELGAVKRLFNWTAEQGLCPEVNWRGVKRLPASRGIPEVLSTERIGAMIAAAGAVDPRLVPWLALGYLTVGRVSEIPRLVSRRGEFQPVLDARGRLVCDRGLFALSVHKNSWRGDSAFARHMLLTDEALEWLDLARPFWSGLDSFSATAIDAGFARGPHVLRDSAASHLRLRGVPLADVDVLLGHVQSGEWRSYALIPWHDLRVKAGRISLRSAIEPPSYWWPRLAPLLPRARSVGAGRGGD